VLFRQDMDRAQCGGNAKVLDGCTVLVRSAFGKMWTV
jgi:hypothetical protein